MAKKTHWIIILHLFFFIQLEAQNPGVYKIHTLAFYNVENLFDSINDPLKFDEASPIMALKYNRGKVYQKKVRNTAKVLAEIGTALSKNAPVIIGLAEIENRQVLEDLANDSILIPYDYGVAHFDSPDIRGIDVALLYQKALFVPLNISSHVLKLYDDKTRKRIYTRDQLLVSGKLEGEMIHIIVNHWPSRRGGEAKSRNKRMAAARLNKRLIDSLQAIDPYAKIFSMGDFNDNPTNKSLKEVLGSKRHKTDLLFKGIYNPMAGLFRNGLGTNAYRDSWSLFDQILITKPVLDTDYSSFRFYKAGIFNPSYLSTKKGRFKGYPFRSFANNNFTGGYSDHFPVYIHIIKAVPK